MTPTLIRGDVVAERIGWIRDMTGAIQKLPVADYEEFINDPRNPISHARAGRPVWHSRAAEEIGSGHAFAKAAALP